MKVNTNRVIPNSIYIKDDLFIYVLITQILSSKILQFVVAL